MIDAQEMLQHGHRMELLTRFTCFKHTNLYQHLLYNHYFAKKHLNKYISIEINYLLSPQAIAVWV